MNVHVPGFLYNNSVIELMEHGAGQGKTIICSDDDALFFVYPSQECKFLASNCLIIGGLITCVGFIIMVIVACACCTSKKEEKSIDGDKDSVQPGASEQSKDTAAGAVSTPPYFRWICGTIGLAVLICGILYMTRVLCDPKYFAYNAPCGVKETQTSTRPGPPLFQKLVEKPDVTVDDPVNKKIGKCRCKGKCTTDGYESCLSKLSDLQCQS